MDGYVETGEEIVMALKQTGISMDDKYVVETMEDIVKTMVTGLTEMRVTQSRRLRRGIVMGMWMGMKITAKQTQANLAAMKEAEKKPNIIETEN